MKDTKQHIIHTATSLFNEKGFFNVSIKEIADEMEISPGNLTYHFKKKEQLLATIQEEILLASKDIIIPEGKYITLEHFELIFLKFYSIQDQYRFFFTNILYLNVAHPKVMRKYKETTSKRLENARKLVDYYISTDRLKPENDEISYTYLIHNLWIVNMFWKNSSSLIDLEKTNYLAKESPIESLWHMLKPYLTEKGFTEYKEIRAAKKILKRS
ncbi:TetR/AcrR family transcriptional regulator [Spongiivirga sp. MCCC 1A20706]|uniref:TetR/AcrR family transcriptional regulator n=1 Tax=Spongiivirga sp. MCCC 1A20706 TaxID=3160963 RepID=UPI003977848B